MTRRSQVRPAARRRRLPAAVGAACCLGVALSAAGAEPRFVAPGPDGRLVYDVDARGNRVPDFSHCGYGGGGVAIPDVPVRVRVPARPGDGTARLQAAIDSVARLSADERGIRGAVLVEAGRHEVAGSLHIGTSGVVLRGQGPDRTVLVAAGTDRRPLLRLAGRSDRRPAAAPLAVADAYVPVGATRLRLADVSGLKAGNAVTVEHAGTPRWVAALGMDRFAGKDSGWLSWRPGALTVRWDRTVTAVDGAAVTLDAP